MSKREWPLRKTCAHPGCGETKTWRYSTQRDLRESYELKHEYRCVRHTKPDEVLSASNLQVEWSAVSAATIPGLPDRFWGHSGFLHGPGFKAFANDFPEGTRLVVVARIEIPDQGAPHG